MTACTDPKPHLEQAFARLTGPGGPFELVEQDVLGAPTTVMRHRHHAVAALLAASHTWGERDYLVTSDRRITFAHHAADVAALAQAFRTKYGIGQGDRVAVLAANTPEWVMTFWAAQALGAITVGLNSWWVPREVAYGLQHSRPTVLVVDAKTTTNLPEIPAGVTVLTMEQDLPALITEFAGAALPRIDIDEDDPAVILYTSGTSGRPKGAVHSQRNLLAVTDYLRFGDALTAELDGQPLDPSMPSPTRTLLTSPLFHIASLHNLVVPRLATGGTVIMNQGAFDPATILGLIEREQVTHWGAVPTMVSRLLEHDGLENYDLSSLSSFALASAPSSPAFKERVKARLPFARNALIDSYGLTECSTAVTIATPADLDEAPGTLGRPIIMVDMQIRDPFGEPVPDGTEGEVCVHSPYVMLGYWDDDTATESAIAPGRWLRTGDYGMVDNGRLHLTGRRSDLILRGGENVYPVEIEQCLDEHPNVVESAVLGAPHADLGHEVAAVVVIHPGARTTEDALHEYASERLSYYKVPTRWRITEEPLPRNATGKVIRPRITLGE